MFNAVGWPHELQVGLDMTAGHTWPYVPLQFCCRRSLRKFQWPIARAAGCIGSRTL